MSMFVTTSQKYTVGKNAPSEGSYESFVPSVLSDSVDVPTNSIGRYPRRIQVLTAGNVAVNLTGGGTAVLTGLSVNQVVFVSFTRILSTGSTVTAANIVCLY